MIFRGNVDESIFNSSIESSLRLEVSLHTSVASKLFFIKYNFGYIL